MRHYFYDNIIKGYLVEFGLPLKINVPAPSKLRFVSFFQFLITPSFIQELRIGQEKKNWDFFLGACNCGPVPCALGLKKRKGQ